MKIQLDIPKNINKELKIIRIENEFKNLQETVIEILNVFLGLKDYKIFRGKIKDLYRRYKE